MTKSMRLLLISIGSIGICLSILMGTRIWGLGQAHTPFQHAFTEAKTPWIAIQANNAEEIREIVARYPESIIVLPVRVSKDFKLYLGDNRRDPEFLNAKHQQQVANPQQQILKGGRISDYPLADIEEFFGAVPLLESTLKEFPQQRFILQIIDNAEGVHVVLRDSLRPLLINNQLLINSTADVIMTATKEQVPEWLYGSGHGDLMRLLSFESIGLEPAAPFKGDVLVAPLTILERPAINLNVVKEVRRRHKKVIIGPLSSEKDWDLAKSLEPDGYIFPNVDAAQKVFGNLL